MAVPVSVGGYFFQAILKTDHSSTLRITEHPVEEGSNIADHAFKEPESLTMEIGMSDAATYLDSSFGGEKPSVSAFEKLKELQAKRQPLTVQTRLKTYTNMLIETITAPDDFTTIFGLRVTIGLREIKIVSTSSVALPNRSSADPNKTGETNRGTTQAEPVHNQSSLSKIVSPFFN